ncbi:MAG TPA: aminotransferase class V-fold PLP-dependent enzyme [Tepidisphaeraceae bacterium]|nr:aminotransferase class V-fold PLP-dependent enzyme [Tepidisphaeraceae bacterium]
MKTTDPFDSPPAPLRPDLRSQWMLKPGVAFLNHGSFGAVPRAVFDAQNEWRKKIEAEPIELLGRRNFELLANAKIPIANWLGMNPGDFGFVTNATDGINGVLRSIALEPDDELLTTTHVYHAVRQAMRLTARRAGATLREVAIGLPVKSSEQIAQLVLEAISPRTRLLVIDHITSPTGLVFPVEKIIAGCAAKGVEVLVDGAHAPGMVPLNIGTLGATYYAANLHKWACAPKGSAFLWVMPQRQRDVHPAIVSHWLDDSFTKEFGWQGTRDISSWLTAPAALAFMADLGWDRIMSHNHHMAAWAHRFLCEKFDVEPLSPLDGSLLGSTATVSLPGKWKDRTLEEIEALQQRIYCEFGIEVPLMRWNERAMLRVSCQVYNMPDEYERLAKVIREI